MTVLTNLSATRFRVALCALFIAVVVLVMLGLRAVAHAGVDAAPALVERPPPVGWTLGDVIVMLSVGAAGLFTAVIAALAVAARIMHLIAPHTSTARDDEWAAKLDGLVADVTHLRAAVFSVLPEPPAPPAQNTTAPTSVAGTIGLTTTTVLILAIALGGSQMSCAAAPKPVQVAAAAVLDCTKKQGAEMLHEVLVLATMVADQYVIHYKPINWGDVGKRWLGEATEIGVCAYSTYKAAMSAPEQSLPSESSVLVTNVARTAPDVALDAALKRLGYTGVKASR